MIREINKNLINTEKLLIEDENLSYIGNKDYFLAYHNNKLVSVIDNDEVFNYYVMLMYFEGYKNIEALCRKEHLHYYKSLGFNEKEMFDEFYLMNIKVNQKILGFKVEVIIDKPIGTIHAYLPDTVYEINSGYIVFSDYFQEVYVVNEDKILKEFTGYVIAIITYKNSDTSRWIVHNSLKYDKQTVINEIGHLEMNIDLEIEWYNDK